MNMTFNIIKLMTIESRLKWPQASNPFWQLEIDRVTNNIPPGKYIVTLDEISKGVLFVQDGGKCNLLYPLRVNIEKQKVMCGLKGRDGCLIGQDEIILWHPGLNLFDSETGLGLNGESPKKTIKTYFVLTDQQISFEYTKSFSASNSIFLFKTTGQEIILSSLIGVDQEWEHAPREKDIAQQNWSQQVYMSLQREGEFSNIGMPISFVVTLPNQISRIKEIAYKNESVQFSHLSGSRYVTRSIIVKEPRPIFRLLIQFGEAGEYWVEKGPRLQWIGASLAMGGQIVFLSDKETVNKAELERCLLEIYLPGEWRTPENRQQLHVCQTPLVISKVKFIPQQLRKVSGYGAPLVIRQPYNSQLEDETVLSGAVVDHGVIQSVTNDEEGTRIWFNYTYELSAPHTVLVWSPHETIELFDYQQVNQMCNDLNCSWLIPNPITKESLGVVSYKGLWVGGWWEDDFINKLEDLSSSSEILTAMALIRWAHLPVLSPEWTKAMRQFVLKNPTESILAWVFDQGLPWSLKHSARTEQENAAQRYFLLDIHPSNVLCDIILDMYPGRLVNNEELLYFCRWLRRKVEQVSPLLFVEFIRNIVRRFKGQFSLGDMQSLVHHLQNDILGCKEYDDRRYLEIVESLSHFAATEAGVDPFFIEAGIVKKAHRWIAGKSFDQWTRSNIAVACSHLPVQKLLTLSLLQDIC